ncbi:MAG: hypothetical protein AB9866_21015 [Syntrophobacteraceae bacterium]
MKTTAGWKKALLVLFTLILCIGIDQLSKALARSYLSAARPLSVAGGVLKLNFSVNKSAEFAFE